VRADRPTKILAVVAVVTFLAAIVTGVSRTQVAGQLADARTDLSSTTSQLAAASDQVDSLQQQTHDLEVAAEQLQTKLDDAQAEEKNTRTSLEACQDAWRLAADFARTGVFSKGEAATVASKIVSCFEGKVPPSIWGG
jgi:septal ring factor EnvC (AmiA/AmiB activator)